MKVSLSLVALGFLLITIFFAIGLLVDKSIIYNDGEKRQGITIATYVVVAIGTLLVVLGSLW